MDVLESAGYRLYEIGRLRRASFDIILHQHFETCCFNQYSHRPETGRAAIELWRRCREIYRDKSPERQANRIDARDRKRLPDVKEI